MNPNNRVTAVLQEVEYGRFKCFLGTLNVNLGVLQRRQNVWLVNRRNINLFRFKYRFNIAFALAREDAPESAALFGPRLR